MKTPESEPISFEELYGNGLKIDNGRDAINIDSFTLAAELNGTGIPKDNVVKIMDIIYKFSENVGKESTSLESDIRTLLYATDLEEFGLKTKIEKGLLVSLISQFCKPDAS